MTERELARGAARRQVDVKFVAPIGDTRRKHYQFTAIDDCTRLRVLRVYDHLNQKTAIQFIDYVFEKLPFRVNVIQADNGAEFQSAFHWHPLDRGVQHMYIKPATPRLNGKVERSHRIDADEFHRLLDGVVLDDARLFTTKLQEWRTSTISTARTEAWVAKLPTSGYAKRPGPLCNRPSSAAHLGARLVERIRGLRRNRSAHPPAPPPPGFEGRDPERRDRQRGRRHRLEGGSRAQSAELVERPDPKNRLGQDVLARDESEHARIARVVAVVTHDEVLPGRNGQRLGGRRWPSPRRRSSTSAWSTAPGGRARAAPRRVPCHLA